MGKSLAKDVNLVTGVTPKIETDTMQLDGTAIIAGSIGNNSLIDSLIDEGKINVSAIQGKWESYHIEVVKRPVKGVDMAIVVNRK